MIYKGFMKQKIIQGTLIIYTIILHRVNDFWGNNLFRNQKIINFFSMLHTLKRVSYELREVTTLD